MDDRALFIVLRCAESTAGQVGRSGMLKILLGRDSRKLVQQGVIMKKSTYYPQRATILLISLMLIGFSVMWHNVDSYAAMFNKVVAEEKIDINTADKEELDGLPEIGPVLSQRIIDYREQHGCFLDIYEIINIKGIGPKTFDGIKDLIDVTISPCPCKLSAMECEASKMRVREKVEEVKKVMTPDEWGRTTYAIAEVYVCCSPVDGYIETWISNAGQDGNLRQEILDAVGTDAEEVAYPDDYFGDGMGDHAAMGLLRKAQMDQVTIISIWATREICEDCENNLREAGLDDGDFVSLLCTKVGPKGKLAAMWSEIRNSI